VRVDPDAVVWRRVLDMNDRALRRITVSLDSGDRHRTRATGFDITAASEVMAVFSLARDLADLRRRLGAIVVGYSPDGSPVTAEELGAAGAMAALLRDALQPNLLQATDGTPVFVHGGPFANIAHGCSSVVADRIALARADYVVSEAGFAADLGAEKFLHLKVPVLGRAPDAVVLVATARAVVEHGERLGVTGGPVAQAEAGVANVVQHVAMLRAFGLPVVVAVNRFADDDAGVLAVVHAAGEAAGAVAVVDHAGFTDGGPGAADLADAVTAACARPPAFVPILDAGADVADKVATLAARVYGASSVDWDPAAADELDRLRAAGFGSLPVCVAKTHRSLSHDPKLAGVPRGYAFPVRGLQLRAGAGFVTVYAGDILTMPGLGAHPRFVDIDVLPDGTITGLA
jgi:formyltetrahydrofolate synthetase